MSIAQLKEMALALPQEERADLAQSLLESLESSPISDEFLAELSRRDDEISSGKIICHTHDEVMANANKILGC
jgi:putative addiction module component (TIGR02574 family)